MLVLGIWGGAWGLIRDMNDTWVMGFARRVGVLAKLWALRDRLFLAMINSLGLLELEMDVD